RLARQCRIPPPGRDQPAAPSRAAHRRAAAPRRGRGAVKGAVHTSQRHDSALKHATGQALYIDDLPEPAGTLHAALVLSPIAHGRLKTVEVPDAPGVVAVLGPKDIPGRKERGPGGR